MKQAKCYKVDRYSEQYRHFFEGCNSLYCDHCNGDLVGFKTTINGEDVYFLQCDNCEKRCDCKGEKEGQ